MLSLVKMTANRRIFLNIVATYGRSLYALVIGLFCGRWSLMALGQSDYGIMGVVGGMTAFISFFNAILGSSIARFYAVTVGREETDGESAVEEGRMWFTTAVVIHAVFPLLLIAIGYPLGEYAVRYWLVMPADRIVAAVWVWRFVCCTCFISMVSVPMNAMYAAKQYIAELTVYSFVTTTLNALFLYYMVSHPGVWLSRYAFWQCLLGVLPNIIIAVRAFTLFPECRFRWKYANCLTNLRKLGGYAMWNAWGGLGAILRANGSTILINVNFGPEVNAGSAVGTNLSGQCNSLSGSLVGAFSPAIFNAWGAQQFERARRLAYQTCKFGTVFILLFAIPLCLEVDEVLVLWLKNPPPYASGFCIFILAMNVIDKLASGQMIAVNANGKIALYQAFLGTSLVLALPVAWVLIRLGFGPYSVGAAMVMTMCLCAAGRVWFARSLVGMSARHWLVRIALPIALAASLAMPLGLLPQLLMAPSFLRVCATTAATEIAFLPLVWLLVLDASEKAYARERARILWARVKGGAHA